MIDNTKKHALGLFITTLVILSCSTESNINQSKSINNDFSSNSCFNQRNINNYKILDRSNLIVYERLKSRAYHIKISPASLDVGGMDMISFQSRTGRICGYAGDELIIPDSFFQNRFSITSVKELNEASLYNLLVRFGKADAIESIEPDNESSPEITRDLEDK